jgi:hypothetical protein
MYFSYVQYLWQIVCSYFDNLKETKTYEPLKELESYFKKYATEDGVNWFLEKIKELRRAYMNYISKPQNIAECISLYNSLKDRTYLKIVSSFDLLEIIKGAINNELRTWIFGEGRKFMQFDEPPLQKIIKMQLENILLRKGFRPNEINIIREPQLSDDTRTDFLVYYGFIGPIIIEIKLGKSPDLTGELTAKNSYKRMVHYMKNYRAQYGIFLVIDSQQKTPSEWEKLIKEVIDVYQKIDNVKVMDLFKST